MTVSLTNLADLNQDVIRNIVNILAISSAFNDLADDMNDDAIKIVNDAMMLATHTDSTHHNLHFHYTTAIDYPFSADNFMASRYSDGTFPAWYGAIDKITSIYETAWHMYRREMLVEGSEQVNHIICERLVYDVHCEAMLIDLTNQHDKVDQLTRDGYQYTQSVGKKLHQQGFSGLMAPSARYIKGVNVNIFKPDVLRQPRINCTLVYQLFPKQKTVDVYQKGKKIQKVSW